MLIGTYLIIDINIIQIKYLDFVRSFEGKNTTIESGSSKNNSCLWTQIEKFWEIYWTQVGLVIT